MFTSWFYDEMDATVQFFSCLTEKCKHGWKYFWNIFIHVCIFQILNETSQVLLFHLPTSYLLLPIIWLQYIPLLIYKSLLDFKGTYIYCEYRQFHLTNFRAQFKRHQCTLSFNDAGVRCHFTTFNGCAINTHIKKIWKNLLVGKRVALSFLFIVTLLQYYWPLERVYFAFNC